MILNFINTDTNARIIRIFSILLPRKEICFGDLSLHGSLQKIEHVKKRKNTAYFNLSYLRCLIFNEIN